MQAGYKIYAARALKKRATRLWGTSINPFRQKSVQCRIPRKRSVLNVLEHFSEAPAQTDLKPKRVNRYAQRIDLAMAGSRSIENKENATEITILYLF